MIGMAFHTLRGSFTASRTRVNPQPPSGHPPEKDPASAAAYAEMANVWHSRQQLGMAPTGEAGPKAKAAALKAVELDDTLATAHGVVADVLAYTDFDFADAKRECKRTREPARDDAASRGG
jgi:hypothetical protein